MLFHKAIMPVRKAACSRCNIPIRSLTFSTYFRSELFVKFAELTRGLSLLDFPLLGAKCLIKLFDRRQVHVYPAIIPFLDRKGGNIHIVISTLSSIRSG